MIILPHRRASFRSAAAPTAIVTTQRDDDAQNPGAGTSFTASSMAIGSQPSGSDRRWIVSCSYMGGNFSQTPGPPDNYVTSVTIGGGSDARVHTSGDTFDWYMWSLKEFPGTETTADVVVNITGTKNPGDFNTVVWELVTTGEVTLDDTEDNDTNSPATVVVLDPISVSDDGCLLLIGSTGALNASDSVDGTGMGNFGSNGGGGGVELVYGHGDYSSGGSISDAGFTLPSAPWAACRGATFQTS